jgi:copper chaperone CopZ
MVVKIKVKGMSCEHCVIRVSNALKSLVGVKDVKVDLNSGEASFEKPKDLMMEDIFKVIKEADYEAE